MSQQQCSTKVFKAPKHKFTHPGRQDGWLELDRILVTDQSSNASYLCYSDQSRRRHSWWHPQDRCRSASRRTWWGTLWSWWGQEPPSSWHPGTGRTGSCLWGKQIVRLSLDRGDTHFHWIGQWAVIFASGIAWRWIQEDVIGDSGVRQPVITRTNVGHQVPIGLFLLLTVTKFFHIFKGTSSNVAFQRTYSLTWSVTWWPPWSER